MDRQSFSEPPVVPGGSSTKKSSRTIIVRDDVVTRTGFEPMLPA